jgi:hypothetical protein
LRKIISDDKLAAIYMISHPGRVGQKKGNEHD